MLFGCVDCRPSTWYKPDKIYLYKGDSLCDMCLKRRQEHENVIVDNCNCSRCNFTGYYDYFYCKNRCPNCKPEEM